METDLANIVNNILINDILFSFTPIAKLITITSLDQIGIYIDTIQKLHFVILLITDKKAKLNVMLENIFADCDFDNFDLISSVKVKFDKEITKFINTMHKKGFYVVSVAV